MINIKINGITKTIGKGSTILHLIPSDEQKKYCLALVNGRVRELTYKLSFDSDIELLDLKNSESSKAYEATMRFILAKAIYELYPTIEFRFSYNVSRSVFCQILTPGFKVDKTVFEAIKQQFNEIIQSDLPIERVTVSIEEAKGIYVKFNLHDKLDILEYRPEKDVHLYKCGNYYNYLHNYMLPSTGHLTDYVLKPYTPGLIFQYPRSELNGQIPKFEESVAYGQTLKKSYQWAKQLDCQTISRINAKLTNNLPVEFIQTCEAKHNSMLAEIAKEISLDIDNVRLIAIAGPSSSGKTTFSTRLRLALMALGIKPIMISLDDYYLDRDKILPNESGEIDLEDINTLDIELFNQHMFALINGDEVEIPHFDFNSGKRVTGKILKLDAESPIIIEGIHALNEVMTAMIPKHQKYKIFISPQIQVNIDNHTPISTTDLRLIRRIVRDHQFRNAPAEKTLGMWGSVRRGEFKWIYPHQEQANYVYNSELSYELCVMKKYALPLLRKIGPDSVHYIVANRLIKYLKYFTQIEEEAIPCNSLLREFIGGSCFKV